MADICEEVWTRGIEIDPAEQTWHSLYKDNLSCFITTKSGKNVLINTYNKKVALETYVASLPIYSNTDMTDGLLTWIAYSTGDGVIKFAAGKVFNGFEFGVKHSALVWRVDAKRIHGAGELIKLGDKININVESGTYICPWLQSRVKQVTCSCIELEEFIQKKIKELFLTRYTLKWESGTFITKDIPILDRELEQYRNAGFQVELFDDKATCMKRKKDLLLNPKGGKHRYTRRKRRSTKKRIR